MPDRSRVVPIVVLIVAVLAAGAIAAGSRRLPDISSRSDSARFTTTDDTRIGRAIATVVAQHPNKAGVVALANGRDAFAARALLAAAAERSLDLQYYIWEDDISGTLLYEALHRAADRGVRVRLLLDDNRTVGRDALLAALDAHPNIEVRLFNPFRFRQWRVLDYVFDFARINRRMHNKTFTVDNQATIIGGRNVGDEYFGANQEFVMYDLDVLAIGSVVDEVSQDFDRYWASQSSYPASLMIARSAGHPSLAALRASSLRLEQNAAAHAYVEALGRQPFVQALLDGTLQYDWARTHLVSDSPSKVIDEATHQDYLWTQVQSLLGKPASDMQLISPYVVPQAEGTRFLSSIAEGSALVQVLTNSLEATDVAAVHAGYVKWRQPLLKSGVRIFELQREPSAPVTTSGGSWGSAAATLHAKSFAVDRAKIFIGSFNFDPRSAQLNTEIGFVIESTALASRMSDLFAHSIPEHSYEVRLSADQTSLEWVERRNGEEIIHEIEPGTTYVRRAIVSFLSLLPIDWML
jgi:putative cardiolipin synthase